MQHSSPQSASEKYSENLPGLKAWKESHTQSQISFYHRAIRPAIWNHRLQETEIKVKWETIQEF